MKRLAFILPPFFFMISLSADLSGKVHSAEAVPISGAKIIIFNEISIALMQRVYTDRNGTFKVSLPPGSYLVWITRDGFAPYFERVLLPSGDTSFTVSWLLHTRGLDNSDQEPSLKYILRHTGRGAHRPPEKK